MGPHRPGLPAVCVFNASDGLLFDRGQKLKARGKLLVLTSASGSWLCREKKIGTRPLLSALVRRDVTKIKGIFHMLYVLNRLSLAGVHARGAAREASSDEALVKRIARGDKLAMQALFARHRTSIYRWLVRFVSDTTLAEDLLSEVFLDVWRQADRFEGRSSVSTWLISIARFKALSARRRRIDAELDEKIEATVADPADDPEAALQKKDRGELLRQALARLSPEHREIIELVYYHDQSVDECAEILGIPSATVKTRMFYARRRLADLVEDCR